MHRMMQSSGTAEGLRGLIDTSILKSLKKIIEWRALFGSSVVPIAINIMATFVHNEPTSLPIIQEAGLPEVFYKTIEAGLEPVIEVIQAIPNAIGALCLNQAGQDQLSCRPSIIPAIFAMFTSERHLKVLQDKENAVLIGTAMDELIRHHPALKEPVFEALRATLGKIEDLGAMWEVPVDVREWYELVPISSEESECEDEDVVMDGADVDSATETLASGVPEQGQSMGEEPAPRSHDNVIVSFIDVVGRFLEGLFQHTPHCKDFITNTDGMERIGRLTALRCLPYDFANSVASDSLVQVMRTMTDVAASETLLFLQKLVAASLEETNEFWGTMDRQSKFLPLVDITTEKQAQEGNQSFRSLVALHIRITLLSDVFATSGYAHGRAAIGNLQTLMGNSSQDIVPDLGTLHRVCIWENILLKAGLTLKGINALTSAEASPLERSPSRSVSAPLEDDSEVMVTANGVPPEPELESSSTPAEVEGSSTSSVPRGEVSKAEGPREQNAKALIHLMQGLPTALAPFFQAIVKLFYARRNPDSAQRKQIMDSATVIASVMLKHISPKPFDDEGDILSSFACQTVMLGTITILLVDERTTQHTLHTVLLNAFYRVGGLDAIFQVCRRFMATIEQVTSVDVEDRSDTVREELVHAYGGLKVALHLIHPLISAKPLHESGQTLLITSRDKKDTDLDYFEPHNFLVRLRLAALPVLKDLWDAPWLVPAPLPVTRSVVQAVMELTSGENEEPKGDSGGEVIIGGPSHGAPVARPTGPDENRIRQLTDMGFPRSAAERALIRTHNNVSAATELLLSHPFYLPPDPAEFVDPPSDAEPSDEAAPSNEDGPSTSNSEEDMQAEEPSSSDPTPPAEPPAVLLEGKSSEQWRKDLNDARDF
jgi:E3 ubiquitin-protein ligase HUWE1